MWIESHQSLRNHPKVKKAARLASVNEFEMIGRLHCLWWWALDYAPDGDLTNYSPADIESAVDWSGTEGAFYSALIGCGFNGHCGFIERTGEHVTIHDWHEYGGRLLQKREANKERMKQARALHVQNTTIARTGATEQTEQTEQNKPIASDDAPEPKKRQPTERQQASTTLENHFASLSGLPLPDRKTDKQRKAAALRWWNPLLEVWELCQHDTDKAAQIIGKAYAQMAHDELTISAPASVLEVAKSIYAKNGQHATPPEAPRKVYR